MRQRHAWSRHERLASSCSQSFQEENANAGTIRPWIHLGGIECHAWDAACQQEAKVCRSVVAGIEDKCRGLVTNGLHNKMYTSHDLIVLACRSYQGKLMYNNERSLHAAVLLPMVTIL